MEEEEVGSRPRLTAQMDRKHRDGKEEAERRRRRKREKMLFPKTQISTEF